VRATDRTLMVSDNRDGPLMVFPAPGTSTIDWLVSASDAALMLHVTRKIGRITARGDWVESTIEAKVTEVLKGSPYRKLIPGDSLTFQEDGGEVLINGTRVVASVPSARAIIRGEDYLLFVNIDRARRDIIAGPESTYQVVGSRLSRMKTFEMVLDDDIEVLPLTEVKERIKDKAGR